MTRKFGKPSWLTFPQVAQHAPKRTITGDAVTSIVERAVVKQPEEEVEKPATLFQTTPLHHVAKTRLPRIALANEWFEQLRHPIRVLFGLPAQVARHQIL